MIPKDIGRILGVGQEAERRAGTHVSDRKIRAAAAEAGVHLDDGAADRRIRMAAGLGEQDGDGEMAKAFGAMDRMLASLARPPAAASLLKAGAVVRFQHGDVGGEGKIVATGKAGVTVQDADGLGHRVRHAAIVGRGRWPARPAAAPAPAAVPPAAAEQPALVPINAELATSYWDFRDRLAGDLRKGQPANPTAERIVSHATKQYGIGAGQAAEWVERFYGHLQQELRP